MGYCTLYGDMAAGLGIISDLPKTLVRRLAAHVNQSSPLIPERVLTKPPSANCGPSSVTPTRCRHTSNSIPCWRHTSSTESARTQ